MVIGYVWVWKSSLLKGILYKFQEYSTDLLGLLGSNISSAEEDCNIVGDIALIDLLEESSSSPDSVRKRSYKNEESGESSISTRTHEKENWERVECQTNRDQCVSSQNDDDEDSVRLMPGERISDDVRY